MPLDEAPHYLEEIYTVMRPGNRMLCSVFYAEKNPYRHMENYCHDRTVFLAAAEQSGFRSELKGPAFTGDVGHNW
jgi:hypothetical protein